jgi:hypothetical protein
MVATTNTRNTTTLDRWDPVADGVTDLAAIVHASRLRTAIAAVGCLSVHLSLGLPDLDG